MRRPPQHSESSKRFALPFIDCNVLYPLFFVLFTLFFLFTAHFTVAVVKSPSRLAADSVSQHNSFARASVKLFEGLVK
jgi:hypothetical protein